MAKYWTPAEDDFLRANGSIMQWLDIGDALGRSYQSVASRAKRLDLPPCHGVPKARVRRPVRDYKAPSGPPPYPTTPKGYTADTLAWAEANAGHPEAAFIRGHHADWQEWKRMNAR